MFKFCNFANNINIRHMTKKLLILFTIASILSCSSKHTNTDSVKESQKSDSIACIQHEFFSLELGKSSQADAIKIADSNNWEYQTSDFEGEFGIDVTSMVTFGGLSWSGMSMSFNSNKLFLVGFLDQPGEYSNEKESERFNTILEGLKKKYKKAEIKDGYFMAQDSLYTVTLEFGLEGNLGLWYSIRADKMNTIPSDL